jgi:hypothetical protein
LSSRRFISDRFAGNCPAHFDANKKWAISPLISPPAGAFTVKHGGQIRLHGQDTAKPVEIQ